MSSGARSCSPRDLWRTEGARSRGRLAARLHDKAEDQLAFDEKYSLGFPLLSDYGHRVADSYDVWGEVELPNGIKFSGVQRAAFLVEENGLIEEAWYRVTPQDTPTNLLSALRS